MLPSRTLAALTVIGLAFSVVSTAAGTITALGAAYATDPAMSAVLERKRIEASASSSARREVLKGRSVHKQSTRQTVISRHVRFCLSVQRVSAVFSLVNDLDYSQYSSASTKNATCSTFPGYTYETNFLIVRLSCVPRTAT